MAKSKHPEYEFPENLGNDFHPYQLKLRFRIKLMDEPFAVKGVKGEPGDYVGVSSDGGVLVLTQEELDSYYEAL